MLGGTINRVHVPKKRLVQSDFLPSFLAFFLSFFLFFRLSFLSEDSSVYTFLSVEHIA